MTALGALAGTGFIAKRDDGSIAGDAKYFEMPVVLVLEPAEQDGKRGYSVRIHIALGEVRE